MLTWTIAIVLDIFKENTISSFLLYTHYLEIPTNKGTNSYKLKI